MLPLLLSLVTLASQDEHPFAAHLADRVPALMREHDVPGITVALLADGEVVHRQAWGTQRAGENVPITPTTGFNVGSVTKMLTAFAVMALVEDERIALDDPAFDHITRWKLPPSRHDADGVTIARLLSHTAGIHGDGVSDWKPGDTLPPIERSLSGVAGARPVRLRWEPGTRWSYANGGYGLLQLLTLEVTEQEFEDYVRERVLEPLGMTRSSFAPSPELLAASATPHHPRDTPTHVVVRRVTATGSLHTALEDLSRFALALVDRGPDTPRGGGVLAPETVARMCAPAPASNRRWGLGLAIEYVDNTPIVGHAGGAWGWGADCWVDPKRGNGLIALGNSTNAGEVVGRLKGDWMIWYGEWLRARAKPR